MCNSWSVSLPTKNWANLFHSSNLQTIGRPKVLETVRNGKTSTFLTVWFLENVFLKVFSNQPSTQPHSAHREWFEEGMVTCVVFVDLSAAYDTVNHRCLLHKILEITKDIHLTELIESMLENRLFFEELGNKKSRWRRLKNGLLQGSVLAPLLFNVYTNDQPRTEGTCCFI